MSLTCTFSQKVGKTESPKEDRRSMIVILTSRLFDFADLYPQEQVCDPDTLVLSGQAQRSFGEIFQPGLQNLNPAFVPRLFSAVVFYTLALIIVFIVNR